MYYRFRSWLAKRSPQAYSGIYRAGTFGGSVVNRLEGAAPKSPRGALLFVVSLAITWVGLFNYVLVEPTPQRLMNLAYQRSVGNLDVYGVVMIVAGVLGMAYSYCKRGHQKTANALILLGCVFWGGGFVYSFLFYDAEISALGGIATWWGYAAVLYIGSGLDGAHR